MSKKKILFQQTTFPKFVNPKIPNNQYLSQYGSDLL